MREIALAIVDGLLGMNALRGCAVRRHRDACALTPEWNPDAAAQRRRVRCA